MYAIEYSIRYRICYSIFYRILLNIFVRVVAVILSARIKYPMGHFQWERAPNSKKTTASDAKVSGFGAGNISIVHKSYVFILLAIPQCLFSY